MLSNFRGERRPLTTRRRLVLVATFVVLGASVGTAVNASAAMQSTRAAMSRDLFEAMPSDPCANLGPFESAANCQAVQNTKNNISKLINPAPQAPTVQVPYAPVTPPVEDTCSLAATKSPSSPCYVPPAPAPVPAPAPAPVPAPAPGGQSSSTPKAGSAPVQRPTPTTEAPLIKAQRQYYAYWTVVQKACDAGIKNVDVETNRKLYEENFNLMANIADQAQLPRPTGYCEAFLDKRSVADLKLQYANDAQGLIDQCAKGMKAGVTYEQWLQAKAEYERLYADINRIWEDAQMPKPHGYCDPLREWNK